MGEDVVLKVIVESGALRTPALIYKASLLAMLALMFAVGTVSVDVFSAKAEENLVRLLDLISEIESRIEPLRNQSEKAKEFFKKAGIRLLQDEALLLQKYGLLIVGRDDRFNKSRKTLPQLIEGYETDSLYTIVLDHQPYHLEEAEKSGIDLQLSGHTHDGQVWPLNYITDLMYENSHGFSRRGETNYYVSSGMGIWGGKFRIGTRSEYVVITIE